MNQILQNILAETSIILTEESVRDAIAKYLNTRKGSSVKEETIIINGKMTWFTNRFVEMWVDTIFNLSPRTLFMFRDNIITNNLIQCDNKAIALSFLRKGGLVQDFIKSVMFEGEIYETLPSTLPYSVNDSIRLDSPSSFILKDFRWLCSPFSPKLHGEWSYIYELYKNFYTVTATKYKTMTLVDGIEKL